MVNVRDGVASDFETVMDCVVRSFREGNPGHLRFEYLYPDSVRADATSMAQWVLAFEGDNLAAGMQVVPRDMVIAGSVNLSVGGIGNVFCCPEFRGRGLMTALLHKCIEKMTSAGQVVSVLGGDRQRYGLFGWEHAGTTRSLALSPSTMRHMDLAAADTACIRAWCGDADCTDRMAAAYHRLPYHTRRIQKEFGAVLSRPQQVVWLCDHPELGFAYVSVRGTRVAEYAGDPTALELLARFLIKRGITSVELPPVTADTLCEGAWLSYARSFSVVPAGMVRVNDLATCLHAYRTLLERRLAGWQGSVLLALEDEPESGVLVQRDNANLMIAENPIDPRPNVALIRLGRCELARTLFGPFSAVDADADASGTFLRQAFPLPFFWHTLSHV